jgi:hypothetical protein
MILRQLRQQRLSYRVFSYFAFLLRVSGPLRAIPGFRCTLA